MFSGINLGCAWIPDMLVLIIKKLVCVLVKFAELLIVFVSEE